MKQNIYDDPEFYDHYMALRASESGFNAAVEEPAVYSLLPPLDGLDILDIGCGFGKFASYCLGEKAAYVLGTDISANMVSEAKKRIKDPRADFIQIAAEDLDVDQGSFDLAVSSMCFHYIKDIRPVCEKVALSLKDSGHFIFSVEHPICTSLLRGWCSLDDGTKRHWPVDDYKKETLRVSRWFVDDVIKYHRTVETYINTLIDAGFSIQRLLEPGPSPDAVAERPGLSDHLRRPPVLVLAAVKTQQHPRKNYGKC